MACRRGTTMADAKRIRDLDSEVKGTALGPSQFVRH